MQPQETRNSDQARSRRPADHAPSSADPVSARDTTFSAPARVRQPAHVRRLASVAVVALCFAFLGGGCKVTDSDIDTWKRTVKGPGKMVAVMLADKYDIKLRTHAASAMVEMERQDVDGVAELQRALQQLDGDVRGQVIDGVTPRLIELMNTAEEGGDNGASVSSGQVRAKDAAFLLIPLASADTRSKLTAAVVGWYVEDFNGRNLTGNFSAEQVVRALGAPAATQLVDALNAKLPQQTMVKLAELIGQLGKPDTRKKAGAKLVAIETEMRGDGFKAWLTGRINEQLAAAGKKVDAAKVAKMAELNRGNFIDGGVIPAMKFLADQPSVGARLLAIASDKTPGMTLRRTRALQALEGKAKPGQLDSLLALALDAGNPASVRDYAFDRVGDIRSPKAIPRLWPLVQDASQGRLRWRAGELVLAIGGSGILQEFLGKLPGSKGVTYEPEELEGYATRMGQMTPQPKSVATAQLASPNWWHQIIGLKYFERKGAEADVARMQSLAASKSATAGKGWGQAKTVGKVAEQAIAGLRDRLKQSAAAGQKGGAS